MSFENLKINQLIIHEIYERGPDRALVDPNYGSELVDLQLASREALQRRITEALGRDSKGVEMEIQEHGLESIWHTANSMIEAADDEDQFIEHSQSIAAKLAAAQTRSGLPGGIVVVIRGTCGHPERQFMCVVKAEPHGGFATSRAHAKLSLQYIEELILTPQSKLYKIGAFILYDPASCSPANPTGGWKAFLFDHLISRSSKISAAQYFYESFLGLAFPKNSAFETKRFHNLTKEFIKKSKLSGEEKLDLLNGLTAYVKSDQSATVQVGEYADTYMPDAALKDHYAAFMRGKKFPTNAIHKDLSEVKDDLRFRKISFGNSIKLTAPAESFGNYISVQSIEGEEDESGQVPIRTQVIVRGRIRDPE